MSKRIQGNFSRPQFDTVATMKTDNLKEGQEVLTFGYYAIADGGDARYLIQTAAAYGSTPDEKGDHTLDNGNIAKLLNIKAINVAQYGAKGDGDSTGATAVGQVAQTYIQAAIDVAIARGGGAVYIPSGSYDITAGLVIAKSVYLHGDGIEATQIMVQAGHTGSFTMIVVPDLGTTGSERNMRYGGTYDMSFNGNDNNAGVGATHQCMTATNGLYLTFMNTEFKQPSGFNVTLTNCTNINFQGCLIRDGEKSQVVITDCANIKFGSDNTIRTGDDWGVLFTGADSQRISFIGTTFIASQKGGIRCSNNSKNIIVSSCTFNILGGRTAFQSVADGDEETYSGDGATQTFAWNHPFIDVTQINVSVDDVSQTYGVDYIVTGTSGAGVVDFSAGTTPKTPINGAVIDAWRDEASDIFIEPTSAKAWNISGNSFFRTFGMSLVCGGNGVNISNNFFNQARKSAIIITGLDCTVKDNYVLDACYLLGNNGSAILIKGQRCNVSSNRYLSEEDVSGFGWKPNYAIDVETTANNGTVTYNTLNETAVNTDIIRISPASVRKVGNTLDFSYVKAGMNADQLNVIAGSTRDIEFDLSIDDTQSDYNVSTFEFTAPSTGFYEVQASVDISGFPATFDEIAIWFKVTTSGGSELRRMTAYNEIALASTNDRISLVLSGKIEMEKTNIGQMFILYQGSSSSLDIESTSFLCISYAMG